MPQPDPVQRASTETLLAQVYDDLRAVAAAYFRRQPPGFTLRPTEMVNEACLNLIQHAQLQWDSPEHFRAIASRKIWQVLVDHLRIRNARKRGGTPRRSAPQEPGVPAEGDAWHRIPLEAVSVEWESGNVDLLDLAEALEALQSESQRLADIIKLHWFGGLTHAETARVLSVSASTVEKDYRYALAWLNRQLTGAPSDAD